MFDFERHKKASEEYYKKFGEYPPSLNFTDEILERVTIETERATKGERGLLDYEEFVGGEDITKDF